VEPVLAQSESAPPSPERTVSLRSAVERVTRNHPAVLAEGSKVRRAEFDFATLKQKKRPDIGLNVLAGLVPEAKGDIFFSENDSDDLTGLGPFYQVELRATQPISTFGKLAAALRVAEQGVRLRELGRSATAEILSFELIQAYWAVDAADRGVDLAKDFRDDYDELLETVEEQVEDPDSELDHTDLLEVKSLEYQVAQGYYEVLSQQEVATKYLEGLLEFGDLKSYEIEVVRSPTYSRGEGQVDRLVSLAQSSRIEVAQARAALAAIEAQVDRARAARRPNLFLTASGKYAEASNRTDQKNPFVFDPFNLRTLGAAVAAKWNLNFKTHQLELARSLTEKDEALQKVRLLESKAILEITKVVAETEANSVLLGAAQRSLKAAKNWLRLSSDNWDMGIGKVDRLLDAYSSYYELSGIAIERESKFNLSLARLAKAIGDISLYLDWIENGTVTTG
jgi:outer membrane protein TolC